MPMCPALNLLSNWSFSNVIIGFYESFSYLQDISAQIGAFCDLEGDLFALGFDAATGLDLVGFVAAEIADRGHDHHFFEVRNA